METVEWLMNHFKSQQGFHLLLMIPWSIPGVLGSVKCHRSPNSVKQDKTSAFDGAAGWAEERSFQLSQAASFGHPGQQCYMASEKVLNTEPMFEEPTANILNSERLRTFSLRSGTKQGCQLSQLLFNIILKSKPQ